MNVTIPSNAKTVSIKAAHPVPRGATHFRFTVPNRKPVIDAIKNLDSLAGCEGKLEYGKAIYQGRGRHAKIAGFTAFDDPAPSSEEKQPDPVPPMISQLDVSLLKAAPGKGKYNRIFGFSACAVAKALGKAGVKYDEADRIFRAHGIEMPKASLSVQLGFGRNQASWERHGQPANLTEAQISELRARASEQPAQT